MLKNNIVVEFTGTAGSGKTHYAEQLFKYFIIKGIPVNQIKLKNNFYEKAGFKASLFLNPSIFYRRLLLNYYLEPSGKQEKQLNLNRWKKVEKKTFTLKRCLKKYRPSIYLFDECWVHSFRRLRRNSKNKDLGLNRLSKVYSGFQHLTHIIYLDCPAEVINKQRISRGDKAFSPNQIEEHHKMNIQTLEDMKNLSPKKKIFIADLRKDEGELMNSLVNFILNS
ncbi:MAG: hypothetical protein JJU28_19570 [Cyclobacteriaceae bacterium]|nr:hypothetical protein [Cyclobacteriaceae bacterium]